MLMTLQQMLISQGTIILYLLVLTLVQLTGFFVFFNYFVQFRKTIKRNRFFIYSIGWMIGIFGTATFLLYMYPEILDLGSNAYLLASILLVLSPLFISFGIASYFASFNKNQYALTVFLFIIFPVICMLIFGKSAASQAVDIENILVYAFLLLIGIINREKVISYSNLMDIIIILHFSPKTSIGMADFYIEAVEQKYKRFIEKGSIKLKH